MGDLDHHIALLRSERTKVIRQYDANHHVIPDGLSDRVAL
jgi:hypothetical protein